ncbi:tetratricopeptide repeat protein [Fodinibius saliphilus]|uniref:tetratricopeptide repeat protein n=1 Tax=Fodinibius saliphilus TaxID=1920650 RepID=UPI0014860188|nr:tetratricopeptide repeat protein [Fodinibius saliphilus]
MYNRSHCIISAFPCPLVSPIFLCAILLTSFVSELTAQNLFQQGKEFYDQRAEGAEGFRADPQPINKSIDALQQAIQKNIELKKSASFLLRAYYFKAMFTDLSEDKQKDIYDKGRELGEKMNQQFPKSAPIKFWYGANLGRWADVHGFIKASTSGIAKKLRRLSKEIIELDPRYEAGGGYRILAQVHFYTPKIPLLIGWPSDEKAKELVEKAMEINPDHPTNRMLYAQVLLEFNQDSKAKNHLKYILNKKIRPDHIIEDRYLKYRSRKLLKENS